MVKHGAIATLLAVALLSCSAPSAHADNAKLMSDIQAHRSGSEEIVEGTIMHVLRNSHGPSGLHERFIVAIRDPSDRVVYRLYVTDNISVGRPAPLENGDLVVVKGELAFNDYGPLLHWTHRDPRMRHAPGFVEVGGHIYE